MTAVPIRKQSDFDLDAVIRKQPDFPQKGVLFYDITSILTNVDAFQYCINRALQLFPTDSFDAIAGVDARGFLFSAPLAFRLKKPLILVRKDGKLPGKTIRRDFSLEYGTNTIEVHADDIESGMRVLIVDDIIATGGTLKATAEVLQEGGAQMVGVFGVIGLRFLNYSKMLAGYRIETLVEYDSETQ